MTCFTEVSDGTGKLNVEIGAVVETGIIHLTQPSDPPPTIAGDFIYVMDLPVMDPPPDQADYPYTIFESATFLNGYRPSGDDLREQISLSSPDQIAENGKYQFRYRFRTSLLPDPANNVVYTISYWEIGQFTPRYVREATTHLALQSDVYTIRFIIDDRYLELYRDVDGGVMRGFDGTTLTEAPFTLTSNAWYIAVFDVDGEVTKFRVFPESEPEPQDWDVELGTGIDQPPTSMEVYWLCFYGTAEATLGTLELDYINLYSVGTRDPTVVGDPGLITSIGRITESLTNPAKTFRLTNGYQPGSTEVHVNGTLQRPTVDYTESNPTTGEITLGTQTSGVVTVVYTAQIQAGPAVTPPLGAPPANTVWYPVAPSTSSDYGGSIHDFIVAQSAAGNTAGFHAGVWRWDARQVFSNSNLRIWADPGATFQRFVAGGVHEMCQLFRCDGFQLSGNLRFIGPASESDVSRKDDAYPNEEEYCFAIYGGVNVTMSGLQVSNFWSDGIYLVRYDDNASGTEPNGVLIQDSDLSICGRQSISVISGRNLTFRRVSGHLLRLHGFDFEPNRDDDVFTNVLIEDCDWTQFDAGLTASGRGFAIAIGGAPGRVSAQNVTIRNQRSDTGVKGGTLYVHGPNNGTHNNVIVTGWTGSTGSGDIARVSNWQQSGNSISLPGSGDVN